MRKKLFFDKTLDISRSMHILIDNGKIREYDGADFIPFKLNGTPQPEFKIFEVNSDFDLVKLPKYDQKKLNINANYKVDCKYLFIKTLTYPYIRLNYIEKFRIDYSKKQSVFHKMNFNQRIIGLIFIALPLIYIGSLIKSCESQPNKDIDHSKKPDFTTNNQAIIIDNKKADSVSIQTIKFERDSLNSD